MTRECWMENIKLWFSERPRPSQGEKVESERARHLPRLPAGKAASKALQRGDRTFFFALLPCDLPVFGQLCTTRALFFFWFLFEVTEPQLMMDDYPLAS